MQLIDAAQIERYAADPAIAATSHVPHPYPRGGGLVFASHAVEAWRSGDGYAFSILADDAFAGLMSLTAVNRLLASAQVGYWIAVPFWGRGIASEGLRLAVTSAFGELGLQQLGAGCLEANLASARVLQKNGFIEGPSFVYAGADGRFEGQRIRTFQLRTTLTHDTTRDMLETLR